MSTRFSKRNPIPAGTGAFFHLTYYRDWLDGRLPLRDMEVALEVYDSAQAPIDTAARMNAACGHTERFRVYESPTKNLSNRSRLLFDGCTVGL